MRVSIATPAAAGAVLIILRKVFFAVGTCARTGQPCPLAIDWTAGTVHSGDGAARFATAAAPDTYVVLTTPTARDNFHAQLARLYYALAYAQEHRMFLETIDLAALKIDPLPPPA